MSGINYLKSAVVRRVPILGWAPEYNTEKFISDAIAGITVGLTVMPQALAYATLAGLEPQVRPNFSNSTQKPRFFPVWVILGVCGLFRLYHFWYMQRYHNWTHSINGTHDIPGNYWSEYRLRDFALFLMWSCTTYHGCLAFRYLESFPKFWVCCQFFLQVF